MTTIKGSCTLTLSRLALMNLLEDEMIRYGPFDGLRVSAVNQGDTNESYLEIVMVVKSPPPSPPREVENG